MMQYYLSPIEHDYGYGYCTSSMYDRTLPKGINEMCCGKPLSPPYYLVYFTFQWGTLYSEPCMNPEDEAIKTTKIAELIKCNHESYIGSDGTESTKAMNDEIRKKRRFCQKCFEKVKERDEEMEEKSMMWHERNSTYFQDLHEEEMKRMNKPIESCSTDVERYIIPLPDRSDILQKEGFDMHNKYDRDAMMYLQFYLYMDILCIFRSNDSLDGESDSRKRVRYFIRDPNRMFPNEQELTTYIQKHHDDGTFQIQYCKIFETGFTKRKHYPKFTIIVHFSRPKGYWEEIGTPGGSTGYHVSNCISCRVWVDGE